MTVIPNADNLIATFAIGDIVNAADFGDMLNFCGTYHSQVSHGVVRAIDSDYANSVIVEWVNGDTSSYPGPQGHTYMLTPSSIVHA